MSSPQSVRPTNEQQVVLYESHDHTVHLDVRIEDNNVWLTRQQLAILFGRDIKTIGKHIGNAKREELSEIPTVAKFATVQDEGGRAVKRQVEHYNLDMILSIGYRVKSREGVYFRRWANTVLKQHLLQGYTINRQRLETLESVVKVLQRSSNPEIAGTAEIMSSYMPSLNLLDAYDRGEIGEPKGNVPKWVLTYEDAISFIHSLPFFGQNDLFGKERNGSFKGIINGLYQTFGGQELYPSTQAKAANLLYQVIKDHPFSDGNKRCAASLFIYFLDRNKLLQNMNGERIIAGNTLTAITLMIALSEPREKDIMIALTEHFIA